MITKFHSYGKTLLPNINRLFSTSTTQSSPIYRPRRALMYVPGSNAKMLGKAPALHADTICMDLEDAVSMNQKIQARNNITSTLQSWQQSNPDASKRSERLVRINAVGTGYEQDDVAALLDAPVLPDGIVLPKVNHPDHVTWLHQEIDKRTKGREGDQKLVIIALIESAKALLSLQSIASSSNRLVGFIFGGDDFAADIGATRTKDSTELLYARQHMVMVGKAYGLQCIDIVNIQFQNLEFLHQECEEGYHFGFTGKQVIHPKQIDVVHKCFAPNPDKVQWAQRVVEESHKFAGQGVGAFTLDGHMIDMPTVKQAENVLIRARACGLI